MTTVISVENLNKIYRLGQIGTGTFANDIKIWWARVRNKPNPLLQIGEPDYGNRDGEDLWALRDVNFTVKQGETLGIIGRNGAGKSTLLKILSRVTAPSSGKIKVRGRVVSLLEVGTGFHPDLTGRENIYLNGAILGMTRNEVDRKFDEIVEFSGIEKFIDTPTKRYSSGMYVRLAFAVAAHLEPEILVVDEVLAVGDAEFQQKCLGKMGAVAKDGRTVLFVSHNMAAISNLTSRCIYMKNGCLIKDSMTDECINTYLIDYSSNQSSHNGRIFLGNAARGSGDRKLAEFEWIRMVGMNGAELFDTVNETEPMVFEIGIRVKATIKSIQYSLGIGKLGIPGMIFIVPSLLFGNILEPGGYIARLGINPNYLREGFYTVNLKMFASGFRQEGIPIAMQVKVVGNLSPNANPAFTANWAQSLMRIPYAWDHLNKTE